MNKSQKSTPLYKPRDLVQLNIKNIKIKGVLNKLIVKYRKFKIDKAIGIYTIKLKILNSIYPTFYIDLVRLTTINLFPS